MQAERWQEIERIFQSALALKGVERTPYLDEACRGDVALQQEVESLLAAYEKTGSFMNVPACDVAARLLAPSQLSSFVKRQDSNGSARATRSSDIGNRSVARPALRKPQWLVLAWVFFSVMLCYAGVKCYINLTFLRDVNSDPKWYAQQDESGARVAGFSDHDRQLTYSLRVADEILQINGKQFSNINRTLEREIYPLTPGSSYRLTIRRDGQLHEFSLNTVRPEASVILHILLWGVLIPALRILIGFTLFILKPSDTRGILLALFLATGPADVYSADFAGWMVGLILIGNLISGGFAPNGFPLLLHFSLIFPETSPLIRRFPRLKYWIYLSLLVTLPLNAVHTFHMAAAPENAANFTFQHPWLWSLAYSVFFAYLAASMLSQVINYRRLSLVGKRTVRVVLLGVLLAGLPSAFWIVLNVVFGWELMSRTLWLVHPSLYGWLRVTFLGVTALLPLTFAYAILRHHVIPVSVVIRRTVQYLFAKNALRFILALPILGLLLSIIAARHRTLDEILFKNSIYFYLLLIIVIGFSLKFRRPLSQWVDRKFFREHYKQDEILRELIEDVKNADGVTEVSRLVSQKVDAALHPESLYLFYRNAERLDLSLAYSSEGSHQALCIPEEFQLLRYITNLDRAQDFPFRTKVDLPYVEKCWLSSLGTELIVPMTGTDHRLGGLFLLGRKKSEIPYTVGDRELLDALASQVAMVYENGRLRDTVERDRKVQHEVLARFERQEINVLKQCPVCGACYDGSSQICESDHAQLTLILPVERKIAGRYRLDRLIGRGGMGAVFEASDLRLGRRVAVKIIGPQFFGDSKALRRFEREAKTAARLNHPHIISVYDYGALETEGAYLVMELVEGETLGVLLKREKKLNLSRTVEVFEQVLEGMAAAHKMGVVHRDLKPDNILLRQTTQAATQVKILDFGLAKLAHPDPKETMRISELVTMPGMVMGTLGYMSPEQLVGGVADERSDLFAVGVMIVEALTGQRPFRGRTCQELLASIVQSEYHLPHDSDVAQPLDGLLQRCLAKDRELRYASAEEMRSELVQALLEYRSVGANNGAS